MMVFQHILVSVFVEYAKYLSKHLNASDWILLCSSAVSVQLSHAYRNIFMTRARISLILCFILIFLSFQMIFSQASAAIVCHNDVQKC